MTDTDPALRALQDALSFAEQMDTVAVADHRGIVEVSHGLLEDQLLRPLRSALAQAAPPSEGLDVERLTEALKLSHSDHDELLVTPTAEAINIARHYAALRSHDPEGKVKDGYDHNAPSPGYIETSIDTGSTRGLE